MNWGLDDNADGTLDADEVDGTEFLCNAETAGDRFAYWYKMTCGEVDADLAAWYNGADVGTPDDVMGATQGCYDYHLGVIWIQIVWQRMMLPHMRTYIVVILVQMEKILQMSCCKTVRWIQIQWVSYLMVDSAVQCIQKVTPHFLQVLRVGQVLQIKIHRTIL